MVQTPAFRLNALFLAFGQGNCYPGRGIGRENGALMGQGLPQNLALGLLTIASQLGSCPEPTHALVQGCSGLEMGLAYTPSVHQVGLSPKAGLLEIPGEASLPHPRKVKPSTHTTCICTVCSPMCIYELCKPVYEHKGVS